MIHRLLLPCAASLLLLAPPAPQPSDRPVFTADGQLKLPADYREWIFLTSGLGMSYQASATSMVMFDNVFVNPSAFRGFQQTGTWPDGTALVLENRGAEGARSINKSGKTQSAELMGLEVHVKDAAHGGWTFYAFDNSPTAKRIARTESCYSCHEQHGAVDTTFVQFYPTLQAAAEAHKTWSKAYLEETGSDK
jgi:hypothetical protein